MTRHLKLFFTFLLLAGATRADEDIATTFNYSDSSATAVEVAGEFSNWKGLPLVKDSAGNWTKTVYLKPGQYGYKFIINGEWKLDPKNPVKKKVNDIENSLLTVGNAASAPAPASGSETVFTFNDPNAKSVHIAGDFNKWLDNVDGKVTGKTEWMMHGEGSGNWKFSTTLAPGRYKFKYVIDGGDRWAADPAQPASPDGNSIIEVKGTGSAPVATSGGGNATFTYADPMAKAIFVAGQFNNWSPTANPLKKDDTGIWTASISVKPGKYQYKFVVDGDWRLDPTCPDSADDGTGNMNSVKTVAP